jgi:hypothetical protein
VRSSLLTFAVEAEDDDGPIELTALGSGSGSYRAESVYIHVPHDWTLEPGGESETIEYLSNGLEGNCLWRVKGGAIVITPAGDKYRILTGQTADRRDRLVLVGEAPKYLRPCDPKIELFSGCPSVRVREGSVEKAARHDELFVRPAGAVWTPAVLPLPAGLYDIGWKHRQTGHLRDRRRIGIVPSKLNIGMRGARHRVDYTISGWTGLSIEGIQAGIDGRWSFPVSSNTSRFAKCRLKWDDGSEASAELPVPHQAGFARWGGGFLPPNSIFTLADAPDIVACSDVPVTLMARLRDRDRRPVEGAELRWVVDDELPVSAIRDDLASLLLPCGDIDAEVELGFNDGIEDYWHVRLFDGALEIERGRVVASKGVLDRDARLVGRALSNPVEELDLGAFSLQDTLNHRPLELPNYLYGPWLIYLRTADAIITRPTLVHEKAMQVLPTGPLAKAMCLDSVTDREEALDGLCKLVLEGGEEAYEVIRAIIALVCSLRGLPPASFDILKRAASFPGVAARLALFSTDSEKPEILGLSDGLPFAWYTIPKPFWEDAAAAYIEFYRPKLEPVYGAGTVPEVLKLVAASARTAAEIQPLLALLLDLACPSLSILEVAQGFIRRSADKVTDLHSASIFRDRYAGDLPDCFSRFEPRYLGVLDAPSAAALAAHGRITHNATELRRIKAVERGNPLYFTEAFSAWYQEKLHG